MEKGLVILLTGLPSAGKTTLAKIVSEQLKAALVDGDVHRLDNAHDFSREGRRANLESMVGTALTVARFGNTCLIAAIAPYESDRLQARLQVNSYDVGFVVVYIAASLEVCEHRDCKGLYRKARLGEIKNFTGVNDPYEEPASPELEVYTDSESELESAEKILNFIREWKANDERAA